MNPKGTSMNQNDESTRAVLGWLAAIGAGGHDELADACGLRAGAVRARLRMLEGAGLVRSERLLHGAPALYTLTRRGLRAAGRPDLDPVAVSATGFAHLLAVARVAAALGGGAYRLGGERDLRAAERAAGRALASAEVGYASDGAIALHRPDLVCWREEEPIAVEVELTVKAPARLRTIVRGWARSRLVAGVVYYASPAALRAVGHALRLESAGETVVALPLARAGELPPF
jgi:hypothetical protein